MNLICDEDNPCKYLLTKTNIICACIVLILWFLWVNIVIIIVLRFTIPPKYIPRRVYKNINKNYMSKKFPKENVLSQFTIVTQISEERLDRLELLSDIYKGPISCAIYKKSFQNLTTTLRILQNTHPNILKNVNVHLVEVENYASYPINFLRNVALESVETPYVLILDADFIPSENFEKEIEKFMKFPQFEKIKQNKGVIAITTFNWDCKCDPLTECRSRSFYDICKRGEPMLANHPAQKYTNFTIWNQTEKPYEVKYQMLYEPYMIGNRKMTKFDPIFDYGNDKVSHSYELAAQHQQIFVLPKAFVGHMKHVDGVHKSHGEHDEYTIAWYHFSVFEARIRKQYNFHMFCEQTAKDVFIPKCICNSWVMSSFCRRPKYYYSLATNKE